jgi:DNA polymerase III epsilon subunit-like protein
MKRLYFDTETTGLPHRSEDVPLESCPHIVQFAAILIDDDEGEVASINVIIQPNDWIVPEEAARVHGITTEKALAFGIPIKVAMAAFSNFCRQSDQLVAHNIQFDARLARYEFDRIGIISPHSRLPHFCTMQATTELCKLPGKFGKYKWPKLIEAYRHLFNEGFEGEHDALADVRACHRIHRHLLAAALV